MNTVETGRDFDFSGPPSARNKCLQKSCRKDCRHEYLLLQWQTQPPNARHRKYEDCEIRDDVEDSSGLKGSIDAKTMASGHHWIPDLLAWRTYIDLKHSHDEIEYQVAPDAQVDPNVDEHVALPGGCEYAKVLKQDRELDEEDHDAVDNGCDIDPLKLMSVSLDSSFGQSHVKHIEERLQLNVPHMSSSTIPSHNSRWYRLSDLEQLLISEQDLNIRASPVYPCQDNDI